MQTIEHPAIEKLREELEGIEEYTRRYSLADAIREGSTVTSQKTGGWADADGSTCALSAAAIAVEARGL